MAKKILKFYSKTCAPCKFMGPVVDDVVSETKAELISIDIDEDLNPEYELVEKYNVLKVPTVIVLSEDGDVEGRFQGIVKKEDILFSVLK